ncbi:MAG: anti-sigma factor [Propionibacteriaceae bacterium]|nr:anti-sigma factor [Propionibacteriaceae bacterium]
MSEMHSLAGPYAVDALDDDELMDFERHLESCDPCRREVAEMRETMMEVGAFHATAPPPMLRDSILGAISATPMLLAEEPPAATPAHSPEVPTAGPEPMHAADEQPPSNVITPAHGFGRPRRPVSTWLAAAAAVLAVGLSGVTVWQQSNLQSIQAADAQRVELLAAPDLQVGHANLDGGDLTYLVSQGRDEALVTAADLPDPGADRSWQVWVMQDGVPRSGAVVDQGGRVAAWVTGVAGGDGLAITNEPRGGSPSPTGTVKADVEF